MKKALWKTLLWATPTRWHLPIYCWRWRITRHVEPEMTFLRRWKDEQKIAIDVGANQGTYSFELARWFRKVEAFEPNDRISSEIRAYDQSRITLHPVALSAAERMATFHVPISSQGKALVGWGTLEPQLLAHSPYFSTLPQFEKFAVVTRTLDSYEFDRVGFIKIDVEGHEKEVLNGSRRTIERCRPILLVEVKFDSRFIIQQFFRDIDYRMFFLRGGVLGELSEPDVQPDERHENFFALPSERGVSKAR